MPYRLVPSQKSTVSLSLSIFLFVCLSVGHTQSATKMVQWINVLCHMSEYSRWHCDWCGWSSGYTIDWHRRHNVGPCWCICCQQLPLFTCYSWVLHITLHCLVSRPHHMHAVPKYRVYCYRSSVVSINVCVCVSVCWTQPWALQKWFRGLRCCCSIRLSN